MESNQRGKSKMAFALDQAEDTDGMSDDGVRIQVSPTNFAEFLPWACMQLEVETNVEVQKVVQETYIMLDRKGKGSKIAKGVKQVPSTGVVATSSEDKTFKSIGSIVSFDTNTLIITAQFTGEHLVNFKIDKCKVIPREVFYLIGLIIQFYPYLTGITINSGLDATIIYEIRKFLPLSNITDIYLDNTFVKEGNHDLLLELPQLKILSLARCYVADDVVKKIAAKLEHTMPASTTLTILNLSSNRLTDDAATALGKTLRTNRKLKYLNVASNMITDDGMQHILEVLGAFPLTTDEVINIRKKRLKYLKKLNALVDDLFEEYRASGEKTKVKPKSPQAVRKGVTETNAKKEEAMDLLRDGIYYEKAKEQAKHLIGEFYDPLAKDSFRKDDQLYSNGNNALAYLNIGYNNLTYLSVQLIYKVIKHQRALMRIPKGLVNLCLEGNPMPEACEELSEINRILELGIPTIDRRASMTSRRLKAKASTDRVP